MTKIIKNVVCVATIKDIRVWIHASYAIPRHIKAERYVVVTPERYTHIFKAVSNPRFEVIAESVVAPDIDLEYVAKRMPEGNRSRAGWYYQQILKISSLLQLPSAPDDVLLIWDADTIPLCDLNFIQDDNLIYFKGREHHLPYFQAIRKLTGLEKRVSFSFIAQCFPIFREWLDEFVAVVENRHGKRWYDAILSATDLSEVSGFSEYETMGTFLANTRPERIYVNHMAWERFGNRICPVERARPDVLGTGCAFVSYESWAPAQQPAGRRELPMPKDEQGFIDLFFNRMTGSRGVIQIGANDGVMEDPLYRYLSDERHNAISAVLIEPLSYYFDTLSRIHATRPNTLMLKMAAGMNEAERKFYHVLPEIADEMNGDGPPNNWAHGQGSFFRESVEFWIRQNQFRGDVYRANIGRYLAAIRETVVNVMPLRSLALGGIDNLLLVIDVQGGELDVLLGVDWRKRPNWLIFEQDIAVVGLIEELLTALGYVYICGTSNPVWGLVEAPVQFVR
ncbi:hypothetical protein TSH7_28545 [Azospirillum sp. TSH7]|uniref:DUF6492 family protein n=1 Tax=unclassified Azospirillum TaxID=2630922 RepID=UPI000D603B7F|nr:MULTISPECIES: DUF6492 family protein [unclassified Azospirillum]PWC56246.1 hypothetical protein TSH7_28545 [Azospirillum sp. TSH7]PWC61247.1 hypothetical protein TSH20_23900 [Azospirillum sp. TSH20]